MKNVIDWGDKPLFDLSTIRANERNPRQIKLHYAEIEAQFLASPDADE